MRTPTDFTNWRFPIVLTALCCVLLSAGCGLFWGDDPTTDPEEKGLVGRFPFSGNASNTAPEHNFACTVHGAELVSDRSGQEREAYSFEEGTWIDCGNVFNELQVPYSIALWVKPNTVAGNQTLFMTDPNDEGLPYYGLRIKIVDGSLMTFYGDGTHAGRSGRRGAHSEPLLTANKWSHLAAVVASPDSMRLYIDGEEVSAVISGTGGAMTHNAKSALFGVGATDGALDDMHLYNRALGTSEVLALYGQ